jgi:sulfane dehydrogenase subunit SoxC
MSSVSSERMDTTTAAIEEALGCIGERISEGEATAEVCKCKEGMFALAATRRQLFGSAGFIAAVGMTTMLPRSGEAKVPPGAVEYPVPADSTKEQGRMMGVDGGYGSRSQFESEVRWANPTRTAAFTPLQSGYDAPRPSWQDARSPQQFAALLPEPANRSFGLRERALLRREHASVPSR